MALTEDFHSRSIRMDGRYVYATCSWSCARSEIQAGDEGWVGNGITLPVVGDALTWGTWTGKITPRLQFLMIDPRGTTQTVTLVGHYRAPRAFGA